MKNIKIFLVAFLLLSMFLMTGCGDKSLEYADMQRDEQNIGGGLSFEYDRLSHVAMFGGEGEIIEYYEEDVARGFEKAGNRIGIKLIAPSEVKDYDTGSAVIGDEKIVGGKFYRQINGKKIGEAVFYPIVDEDNRKIDLKIKWEDGTKEQVYSIIIKENTLFDKPL